MTFKLTVLAALFFQFHGYALADVRPMHFRTQDGTDLLIGLLSTSYYDAEEYCKSVHTYVAPSALLQKELVGLSGPLGHLWLWSGDPEACGSDSCHQQVFTTDGSLRNEPDQNASARPVCVGS